MAVLVKVEHHVVCLKVKVGNAVAVQVVDVASDGAAEIPPGNEAELRSLD